MTDPFITPAPEEPEEFAKTREHEYQDPHYHDEDLDIIDDEEAPHPRLAPPNRKKTMRQPPPKRRHYED